MGNIIKLDMTKKARPLTPIERRKFEKELHIWKNQIVHGKLEDAAAFVPQRDRYVRNFAEINLHFLYNLFLARYYRAIGSTEDVERLMAYLAKRQPEFDDKHNFHYYHLLGSCELEKYNYKEALKAFFKAEEVGAPEWADIGYYYNFAYCLTDMGYTRKAIDCMKKAQELADDTKNRLYDVYIQSLLAQNYARIGQSSEALKILKGIYMIEKARDNPNMELGFVCVTLGDIYCRLNNYSEALAKLNEALPHLVEGSGLYMRCLYYKASALIFSGLVDDGISCIDECISTLRGDLKRVEIQIALMDTIKHFALLPSRNTAEYMKTTAIQKLIEFGFYDDAIDYYQLISDFYEKAGDMAQVLEYNILIKKTYKKYINERVEEL